MGMPGPPGEGGRSLEPPVHSCSHHPCYSDTEGQTTAHSRTRTGPAPAQGVPWRGHSAQAYQCGVLPGDTCRWRCGETASAGRRESTATLRLQKEMGLQRPWSPEASLGTTHAEADTLTGPCPRVPALLLGEACAPPRRPCAPPRGDLCSCGHQGSLLGGVQELECRNGVQTGTLFQGPPNNRVHPILTTEMFSISSKKPPQNRNKQKVKSVKLRTTKTQHDLN